MFVNKKNLYADVFLKNIAYDPEYGIVLLPESCMKIYEKLVHEMLLTAAEDIKTIVFLEKIIAEENRHIIKIKDYFHQLSGQTK